MNIDVREYLRINPISVHELTLSGDGKDCFLYFPDSGEGYEVKTQDQMFDEIRNAIFQNLIGDDGKLRCRISGGTVEWDEVHLTDFQFTRYARNHVCPGSSFGYVWSTLMEDIEERLRNLENGLQQKINALRKNGVLNYVGAVELQSPRFDLQDVSKNFSFSNGFIWCYGKGKQQLEGTDQAELGTQPLQHSHVDTKSETMTISFVEKKGGGKLIGEFCVGNKVLVSQDTGFHIGESVISQYTPAGQSVSFTYPLYGQNVLDWRTPGKTHNNVPPCVNIMVKYKPSSRSVQMSRRVNVNATEDIPMESRDVEKLGSVVEAKYEQSTVAELPEFTRTSFTESDLLLRISADNSGDDLALMKQTLKVLLDIFADMTERKLCMKYGDRTFTLGELLRPILDLELVVKSDFLVWYRKCLNRLEEANAKIALINELVKSVPPLPYVGKIIISTTDDVETKVIAHYGGKRWRRIVNFLRGVPGNDESLGRKFGEEYVCLRESNIPLHTHDVKKQGVLSEPPETQTDESKAAWMCRQRGGSDKKIVQVEPDTDGAEKVDGVGNIRMGYQISPLEYGSKDYATIPHNNMPPYMEVYIWECLEITEYEELLVGSPGEYDIVYLMNGVGNRPSTAKIKYRVSPLPSDDPRASQFASLPYVPPTVADTGGYHFSGWTPTRIPISARETFTFNAGWHNIVTFNPNGGEIGGGNTRNVAKGTAIGTFPDASKQGNSEVIYDLAGWYANADGTGTQYTASSTVSSDITLYAKWVERDVDKPIVTVKFNGNGGTSNGMTTITERVEQGAVVTAPTTFGRTGYSHTGWTPAIPEATLVATKNQTFVAKWVKNTHTATFDANGGIGSQTMILEYGARVNMPVVERENYDFVEWRARTGSPAQVPATMPDQDIAYDAQWQVKTYTATFNPNGGTGGGTITLQGGAALNPPTDPLRSGYTFVRWNPTPPATMPYQDVIYEAEWCSISHTITFDGNGGIPATQTKSGMQYLVPVGTLPEEPTRENYVFLGWFNDISIDRLEETTPYPFNEDSTYVAEWLRNVFTATYDSRGGLPATQTRMYQYGQLFGTLPTAQKPGYAFINWENMEPEFEHSVLTPNTVYNIMRDVTYYAVWEPVSYTISYDMNGRGSVPENAKRTYQITDATYAPPTPAAVAGCQFAGWTPENIPTGSYGNKYFTANWLYNTYTITFDSDGGSNVASISGQYASNVTAPASPTKEGYIFTGWNPEVPKTMPSQNTVCVAQWQLDVITEIVPKSTTYNTDFTAEANGWYNTYQAGSEGFGGALKWIGSSHTSYWIAFQGGYGISEICTRLFPASNPGKKFFYDPPSGTEKGSRSSSDGGNSDMHGVTVGVGGAGLTKIVAKPNVLIAKIQFSPNASCVTKYSTYSSSNGITVKNNGNYFSAYRAPRGSVKSILSIGNSFEATMKLSDGSTVTATASGTNHGTGGWVSQSGTPSLETCTFDFSSKLVGKPLGTTTDYITFKTNRGSLTAIKTIVVNGVQVYKHQP